MMKKWILHRLAKAKMARLHRHNEELVEHFADTLEAWKRAVTPGDAQHAKMTKYVRTMLNNLRLTSAYLAEQRKLMEDRHEL